MPFAATWTALEVIVLSEVSQKEKDQERITYTWNLKYETNESIYRTETDSQTQRTHLWLPMRTGWKRAGLGVCGQQRQALIYRRGKQGPTVQWRELYSASCAKLQWKRKNVYIGITESLCCKAETSNIVDQLYLN